jgi:hypothetical protein
MSGKASRWNIEQWQGAVEGTVVAPSIADLFFNVPLTLQSSGGRSTYPNCVDCVARLTLTFPHAPTCACVGCECVPETIISHTELLYHILKVQMNNLCKEPHMAKVQMGRQPIDSSLNIFSRLQSWTGLIATNIVCQHRLPLNAEMIGHLIFFTSVRILMMTNIL